MKTGQHFFDQLPTDIQAKFKANVIKQHGIEWFNNYMAIPINTWGRFLTLIGWDDSNEKEPFWYELYKEYTKHDYARLEKEITESKQSAPVPINKQFWAGFLSGAFAMVVVCIILIYVAL
jgi:hypothetical protein